MVFVRLAAARGPALDIGPGAASLTPIERAGLSTYLALRSADLVRPAGNDPTPITFSVHPGESAAGVAGRLAASGHKGYGLALVAELLGDALLGEPHELNWFIVAIDIASFRPVTGFVQASEEFLQEVKNVPPARGFDEVLIPGEPEAATAERRAVEGIPIPDETWQKIQETAQRLGVDLC